MSDTIKALLAETSTKIETRNALAEKLNVLRNGLRHWGDHNGIARRMEAVKVRLDQVQEQIDFNIALCENMAA